MVSHAPESKRQRDFKRNQRLLFVLRDGVLDDTKRGQLHRLIPADSPTETMHYLERGIDSGEFTLADIYEGGERIGFTVYMITENEDGKEFLSIASYAKGQGDVTTSAMPILEGIAKAKGCKTIRLHTMRTGLVKKLTKNQNWFVSEIVLRKEL